MPVIDMCIHTIYSTHAGARNTGNVVSSFTKYFKMCYLMTL